MAGIGERLKQAWSAFMGRDPTLRLYSPYGFSVSPYGGRRLFGANDKTIITTVYNLIAVDVSTVNINHVKVDENENYVETIRDSLNDRLSRSANLDQTGRSMIRDAVMTMLEYGVAAIAPVRSDVNPEYTSSYQIQEMRVGKIIDWMPEHVRIEAHNEKTGRRETFVMSKRVVAIAENPFYAIMNEPNSTAQRLLRILGQLDQLNETSSSGKMDMIIQLPYSVRHDAKVEQAKQRRQELEAQLTNSKYGIGYIGSEERVIQLNRPLENNLWDQAKELTEQLFNQLGMTKTVFDGTADEQTMLNFQNRTIVPILNALVEEMDRKWISKTARTQGQAIRYFIAPFRLVPVAKLADIVDKFTRNEVMSSNEFRSVLGMRPSDDPKADMLINSNLNHPETENQVVEVLNKNEEKEEE